jgi:SAM-dependent methyltransferase
LSADAPWWEAAFRSDYLRVYAHRDLESARREVEHLVRGGVGGRVLDLACGFGRHSVAFAAAGCRVVGLDLSAELLARASTIPGGAALHGRLARGDVRRLPFAARSFDAVAMLFTSFGYFDDEDNARVLDELARVTAPAGLAVLDLMNPDRIRARLVPESHRERDGYALSERRSLVDDGRRVVKEVRLTTPTGERRAWREDVRLVEPAEIHGWLTARGFEVERTEAGFDGAPFTADSDRQLVWARRRG